MATNDPAAAAPASPASTRGRPSYLPSEKHRRIAEALSGWGIPWERIAQVIGVTH